MAQAIELVNLKQCKDWLGISQDNTDQDKVIQMLLSSFSQYVLNQTGISSFNEVVHYIEVYDGNGTGRMFIDNPPIVTLNSVTAGALGLVQNNTLVGSGIYVERSRKSIAFRRQGATTSFCSTGVFPLGQGNIQVDYTGGYTEVPFDLQEAVIETVAVFYARKDWKDLASVSQSAGGGVSGTTSYHKWHLTPAVKNIIEFYSRYARP